MKKMIVSAFLVAGLVCSGAFAVTKKSNFITAWSVDAGSSVEYPIEFKPAGSDATATIMFTFDHPICVVEPSQCPKLNHVKVLFNGKPVFHGENVLVGQTHFFNIQENGILTIQSLDPEASVAFGQITLSL